MQSKKPIPTDWIVTPYLFDKNQVARVTGYSPKHIEDLVAKRLFPAPVRLAINRSPRWLSTKVATVMGVSK
jgi:predicted DNA-binding transcriptional regulator AlpA